MADWTDLTDSEKFQAEAIYESLKLRPEQTPTELCSTFAIPLTVCRRELSALDGEDRVMYKWLGPEACDFRDRRYRAVP